MASSGSVRRMIVKKDDVDALLADPKAGPNRGVRHKLLVTRPVPPSPNPAPGLVRAFAERLGTDTSSIAVVSGHSSPAKVLEVDGMDDEAIREAFPREQPRKSDGTGTKQ